MIINIVLLVVIALVSAVFGARTASILGLIGYVVVAAYFVYPGYCLAVKRRHDRNSRGIDVLIYLSLNFLLTVLFLLFPPVIDATGSLSSPLFLIPAAAAAVFAVYFLVVLGFLAGTNGENRFGPAPVVRTSRQEEINAPLRS